MMQGLLESAHSQHNVFVLLLIILLLGADGLEGGWEAVKETIDLAVNALRTVSRAFLSLSCHAHCERHGQASEEPCFCGAWPTN